MLRLLSIVSCMTYIKTQQGQGQGNPGCLLVAVGGNPRMFQVNAPFQGNRVFPCPENTLFDQNQCGCGWVENPVNRSPEELASMRDGGTFGVTVDKNVVMTEIVSTTRPPCTLRPHADRHMYEEFILGYDWINRRCPMGTLFNAEACACHDVDPNQKYTCQPELWINFNGREIEDSAGYQISVGNNGNVVNVSNAGRFDGTGTLTVWQFANQDLGTQLEISLRFYEFPGGIADEQVLISNCYGRQHGSVEITLNQQTKEVIFRVEARLGKVPEGVELRLPYREKSWKNVTLSFDGTSVIGKVDEEIKTALLKGHITTRYNGLLIGSCNGRSYVGYIDDLRLYRCLTDSNQGFNTLNGNGNKMDTNSTSRINALP